MRKTKAEDPEEKEKEFQGWLISASLMKLSCLVSLMLFVYLFSFLYSLQFWTKRISRS